MSAATASAGFTELHPPLTPSNAVTEATRCLECGGPYAPAPCTVACPTLIDIPRFIREIREGKPLDSAQTIFRANSLGGTCARVCPVEVLCEGSCVLVKEGRRAVQIGRLQRYATDWAIERHAQVLPEPAAKGPGRRRRVAVVGAGPASLSCAAELALLGYAVDLYEARSMAGGLVPYAIAPYKQLSEPMPSEAAAIERLGVRFHYGTVIGQHLSLERLQAESEAVFLGVGLGEDKAAGVPGEDLDGIFDSLPFIEAIKLGDARRVSLGDRVVVVGGGNTAIDVAREAVRLQAREVTVVYRRTEREMPAYRHEYEAARREGVRFLWLTAPKRFLGNGRVRAVECIHLRLTEPDASGRARPEPVPGTEFELDVDSVIKAIGQSPRADLLQTIRGLELAQGLVKTDEWGQTTNPKYFAAGDCVNGGRTVVAAVAEGKRAAQGIQRYLNGA